MDRKIEHWVHIDFGIALCYCAYEISVPMREGGDSIILPEKCARG